MFRIIHSSSDTGSKECVVFTTDTDSPAEDFVPIGLTLTEDVRVDADVPYGLPFEYELWKAN